LAVFTALFGQAQASSRGNLPEENNIFWTVLNNMSTPNDTANCQSGATAAFLSEGMESAEASNMASSFCNELSQMDDQMLSDMAIEGITTNLFSASDWHNIENLYFMREGYGRIEFSTTINFMSYSFMSFMENFASAMEMQQGLISLDSNLVEDFKNLGATLTMYNVPDLKDPEILVDGKKDSSGIVSNLVYDRKSRTITFNAAHFTTFEAVDSALEIDDVSYRTYINRKGELILRAQIRGTGFHKKTKAYFGGVKAYTVDKKSSTELVAKFKMSLIFEKILKKGKGKLRIALKNPGDDKKTKCDNKKTVSKVKAKSQK